MKKKDLQKLLQENIHFAAPSFSEEKKRELQFNTNTQPKSKVHKRAFPISFVTSFTILILVIIGITIFPQQMKDSEPKGKDPSNVEESVFDFENNFKFLNAELSSGNQLLHNHLQEVNQDLDVLLVNFKSYEDILAKAQHSQGPMHGDDHFSGNVQYESESYNYELGPDNNFILKNHKPNLNKTLRIKENIIYLILEKYSEKIIFAYGENNTKVLKKQNDKYEYLYTTENESYLYISNDNLETMVCYYYVNNQASVVSIIPIDDINKIKTEINNLLQ